MAKNIRNLPFINAKSWMRDLLKEKPNIVVGNLIIPGTHDSAAYTLQPFSGAKKNYINRLATVPIFGRLFRSVASISAVTQKLTIKGQLEAGARSLDLRLIYSDRPAPGQFCLAHCITCIPLQTCLDDTQKFIQENPDEMLIVNIKPDVHNKETLTEERKSEFVALLTEQFTAHLWKTNGQVSLPTQPLANMKNKIIFTLKDLPVDPRKGLHAKESLTNANWAKKPQVESCFVEGKKFFTENHRDTQRLMEIDASPTPSPAKGTALVLYKILSSVKLYELICFILRPFARFFCKNPESIVNHFLEAEDTTLEKNAKTMRKKLIEDKIPHIHRGGIIFPSDFFCGSSANHFISACIKKSRYLSDILEAESAIIEDDYKEEPDTPSLNPKNNQTLILSQQPILESFDAQNPPMPSDQVNRAALSL